MRPLPEITQVSVYQKRRQLSTALLLWLANRLTTSMEESGGRLLLARMIAKKFNMLISANLTSPQTTKQTRRCGGALYWNVSMIWRRESKISPPEEQAGQTDRIGRSLSSRQIMAERANEVRGRFR